MHRPIRVNATVKVTGSDWIVLGDIRFCVPEREHFSIGLQIEHLLTSLAERARLSAETEPLNAEAEPRPEGAVLALPQKPQQLIA